MARHLMRSYRSLAFHLTKQSVRFSSTSSSCVVQSHNEWDPLEEVIVGRLEGATIPPLTSEIKPVLNESRFPFLEKHRGRHFPSIVMKKATKELEYFCSVLESEGVTVRRPDIYDHKEDYKTPDFYSEVAFHNANPRDVLIVIGNEIIEAPMCWRSRFFEYRTFRTLVKEYFSRGAKWTAAPKPLMSKELYDETYPLSDSSARQDLAARGKYVTTEFEPCFDAADFYRAGRDIFAQRSHATNYFGIEWMRQHLGKEYTIREISFNDPYAMHIDCSMNIPKPGIIVIQPCDQADFFRKAGWKVYAVPLPNVSDENAPLWMSSAWLSANSLSLDTERIIVEAQEYPLIKFYEDIGLKCIKVPFRNAFAVGGGFHCYTCDIRRRGDLESYF